MSEHNIGTEPKYYEEVEAQSPSATRETSGAMAAATEILMSWPYKIRTVTAYEIATIIDRYMQPAVTANPTTQPGLGARSGTIHQGDV